MAWIRTIDEDKAKGPLAEVYASLGKSRGKVANIMKAQSLDPVAMHLHAELYVHLMFRRCGLSRAEREFVAVVVSATNRCEYCFSHHKRALNFYWKDTARIDALKNGLDESGVDKRLYAMGKYAVKLTSTPYKVTKADIDALRKCGLNDEDILELNLVVSYFNFVNRIALGLGVEFSRDEVSGYKY